MKSSDWFAGLLEGETYGLPDVVLRSILTAPSASDSDVRLPRPQATENSLMDEFAAKFGKQREDDLVGLLTLGRMLKEWNMPVQEGQGGVSPSPFRQPQQSPIPDLLKQLLGGY